VPRLGRLSITVDQRIVTVALVVILFDGGMQIGRARMRTVAGPVAWLGIAGTVITAAALACAAHWLFGLGWRLAMLLGTAVAPTDPAVVFSVLGRREIEGRSGVLLQGESGANDPVGIALMVSLLAASGGGWSAVGTGVWHFVVQLGVGCVVGVAGGALLVQLTRRLSLPSEALYPVQTLACTLVIYGAAAAVDGSGFLAVFVTGILVGDEPLPAKAEIDRFTGALASLAEIVAFAVLGLSISLHSVVHGGRVWQGLALAALLIVVVRPLLVGLVLAPVRLDRGERAFVLWCGLKGAVPILLGTYVVGGHVAGAARVYDLIFVVVLVSVLVQGGLVPAVARVCRVPMREATDGPVLSDVPLRQDGA
jgi:cell volume regulation protein A